MKSLIYTAVFLTLCSESQASRTQPHSECQDQTIQAPILTYEMMEDQELPFEENWSALTINGEIWHVHWAYEARGPLKELFPPETYFYRITCIDSSGLKCARPTPSLQLTNWHLPPETQAWTRTGRRFSVKYIVSIYPWENIAEWVITVLEKSELPRGLLPDFRIKL